jgi:hypothetical protein
VAAPRLDVILDDYQDQGVEVLSIGFEEPVNICNLWRIQYSLTYPVLSDTDGAVTVTYVPEQGGINYFPHIAIIDENQIVQYTESNFNEPQIRSTLNGMMDPEISVSPNSLSFGSVMQGRSSSRSVWVDNIGTGIVEVTNVTSSDPDFQITPTSGLVYAYNDLLELTVTFAPSHLGEYSDSLLITSTCGDALVTLSGTGVELIISDLTISRVYNHAMLSWSVLPAAAGYNIYSCSQPNVEPIPDNYAGHTTLSSYMDFNAFAPTGPNAKFYCITAVFGD